jgi:hypothetical protein
MPLTEILSVAVQGCQIFLGTIYQNFAVQGCQIFLGTIYQNLQNYTSGLQNIPSGHNIYQTTVT